MLSGLIWIPVLGALLVAFWPQSLASHRYRTLALVFATITLGLSVVLASRFIQLEPGQQFQEALPWLDNLGLTYRLGVDGLSLPLVMMNCLLTGIAIYSTDEAIRRPRLYYGLLLLLSASVTGAFLAQNLLLFFLFYEVELIPLYLLIVIWGGDRRGYAATKFLIYQALSGIVLLVGFLAWAWTSGSSTFTVEAEALA